MSRSAWQSSLIMSGPDDRTSMKAAVNGKAVVRRGGRASVGVARGGAENAGQERTDEAVLPPTA